MGCEGGKAHHWLLIVHREVNTDEGIKYSFSNAPKETSLNRLAQMPKSALVFRCSFQEARASQQGWNAWGYHRALVMMAMLFILKERIENEQDCHLLSCADIETLLAHFLPRRDNGVHEVIRQMEEGHRKR